MFSKNLGDKYSNRFASQETIDLLLRQANDGYSLSIPLLASGLLGDLNRFNTCSKKMIYELNKLKDDGFKVWLYGRLLLSAGNIRSQEITNQAKNYILHYLDNNINDRTAFLTWAIGYIAAFDKYYFDLYKSRLIALSNGLNTLYLTNRNIHTNPNKIQSDLSDAIWAWIMVLQAAAFSSDKTTYDFVINEIKTLSNQSSLANALENSLLRTQASNDYPAWGLAIAAFSAASINDEANFEQLCSSTSESLKGTIQATHEEAILAKLTLAMAELRRVEALTDLEKRGDLAIP